MGDSFTATESEKNVKSQLTLHISWNPSCKQSLDGIHYTKVVKRICVGGSYGRVWGEGCPGAALACLTTLRKPEGPSRVGFL